MSLTLSKPKGDGDKLIEEKHNNIENIAKDSGYHTIITYNTAIANVSFSFCALKIEIPYENRKRLKNIWKNLWVQINEYHIFLLGADK